MCPVFVGILRKSNSNEIREIFVQFTMLCPSERRNQNSRSVLVSFSVYYLLYELTELAQ